MAAPTTYIDGAGREKCSVTGKEVTKCWCTAHSKPREKKEKKTGSAPDSEPSNYREWKTVICFGDSIPKKGDIKTVEAGLKSGRRADVKITISRIINQEWYYENGIVTGLLIEFACWIEEVKPLPGRPILKLVK